MNDILFDTIYFFQDSPLNTTWTFTRIDLIPNYYVLRISLPERISIS